MVQVSESDPLCGLHGYLSPFSLALSHSVCFRTTAYRFWNFSDVSGRQGQSFRRIRTDFQSFNIVQNGFQDVPGWQSDFSLAFPSSFSLAFQSGSSLMFQDASVWRFMMVSGCSYMRPLWRPTRRCRPWTHHRSGTCILCWCPPWWRQFNAVRPGPQTIR